MKRTKLIDPAPSERCFGDIEPFFYCYGAMPTGISVSETRRVFTCFPQWGDHPRFGVGEICNGQLIPYPNLQVNQQFISIQSIVCDWNGSLWVLDTGAPNFNPPVQGGARLIQINLETNTITRIYTFPDEVVLPTTYLNDVRFDLSNGCAYITDSSLYGPGAIIVLDLQSGASFRRLSGHPTTSPAPGFLPKTEGCVLMNRDRNGTSTPWNVAVDGIGLSPDRETLYYCPLSSRVLYSVPAALLRDPRVSEQELSFYVNALIEKGASDGLVVSRDGCIYTGDYETCSIRAISPDLNIKTIAHDPRILWPDTFSIGPDCYLYFTCNQLHRQPGFHYGRDLRKKPYCIYRINICSLPA